MNLNYKQWNNLLGWVTCIIAFISYLLTMEPNFSFWDCGEYISSAVKLEITHSPGAAFFQILGAVFSILSFNKKLNYGKIINGTSALYSALTVLFLFWSISYFILESFKKSINDSKSNKFINIIALGGALVGSLTFTFTDTFWFSAVEGEVYAMASCFIAMLLWIVCKFEKSKTEADENRWILLAALIIGISIGVHMMVLLVIPTLCFVYYNKKYEFSWKTFFIANGCTFIIFYIIFKIIFPLIMQMFGKTEIFFVNELGLPFHTGSIFIFLFLFFLFLFFIRLSIKFNFTRFNLIINIILFILIGFSSWLVIPIRANANPPMNLNNPNNAIGLLDYYNREQYGEWPVDYGANYTAHLAKDGILKDNDGSLLTEVRGNNYEKSNIKQKYIKTGEKIRYKFNPKHQSWFPRMYHQDLNVMENYATMTEYPDFELDTEYFTEPEAHEIIKQLKKKKETRNIRIAHYQKYQELLDIKRPTYWQNFKFFINYQIGFMLIRYFFWNYVGRQNDLAGRYEVNRGNWVSGINWFDEYILELGNQDSLPRKFRNKSTNYYYFLPFFLGVIGLVFHLTSSTRKFYALLSLFLLTSIGIIIYTNVRPFEPRERDYALIGSFYVFAIWIGIGASFLMSFAKLKKSYILLGIIFLITMVIPILLVAENWDDHDRSRRTAAYDQAYCYLNGLDYNSILFTYGDNDTYPLWSIQETSEFRTDVKVINHTLLGTPWNIDQVKRKTYKSSPIPGSMKYNHYQNGKNDIIFTMNSEEINHCFEYLEESEENISKFKFLKEISRKDAMTAKEAINYLLVYDSLNKEFINTCYPSYRGGTNLLPVKKIIIPVNKKNVIKYGIVAEEDANLIENSIQFEIKGSYFRKEMLAFLDLLANYNWDRSIYFSSGGVYSNNNIFFLKDYLQFEGFTYKFVPIKNLKKSEEEIGRVNSRILYKNIKKFKWSNFKNIKIHYDETSLQNIVIYRNAITRATQEFLKNGEKNKAIELLDLLEKEIPIRIYPSGISIPSLIYSYLLLKEDNKAEKMIHEYQKNIFEEWDYYYGLNQNLKITLYQEIGQLQFQYAKLIENVLRAYKETNQRKKIKNYIQNALNPIDKRFKKIFKKNNLSKNSKQLFINYYGHILQLIYNVDSSSINDRIHQFNFNNSLN